jgi:hypothetical protein
MTRARHLGAHLRHAAWVTGYSAWLLATGWRDTSDRTTD